MKIIDYFENRTLLHSLISKQLIGKYAGSYLGSLWHIFSPLGMLLLYYTVFGSIFYSHDDTYWIYLSVGIFPFFFFQANLFGGSTCLINESELLKKRYFPRSYVVLAEVVASFIELLISYVLILGIFFVLGVDMDWGLCPLFLPILIISFVFALGYSLVLSVLTVFIRDIQHVISTFSRVLFWITPLFFYINDVSNEFVKSIIYSNPFTYFVELYHDIFYYQSCPDGNLIVGSIIIAIVSFILGIICFNKYKDRIVEEL